MSFKNYVLLDKEIKNINVLGTLTFSRLLHIQYSDWLSYFSSPPVTKIIRFFPM